MSWNEMKDLFGYWKYGALLAIALIAVFCGLSVYVLPDKDSYAMIRYFMGVIPRSAWAIVVLPAGALFFDYITKGSWFDSIHEGNIAVAIVLSTVIFTLGMLLCYV